MNIRNLTLSALLGLGGLTWVTATPVHAQSDCASNNFTSACADIYSATPDRVRLNLGQREVIVNTVSQPNMGTFANFAPSNNILSKGADKTDAFNVLTTSTYARADLRLSDGSLVWTKPNTQIALAQGKGCGLDNLYKSAPGRPPTNLCLRSGSILVIAPPNQAKVAVVTDEGTIFTPGTVYLVSRDAQRQRTEVFVFSGAGPLRVLPANGIVCTQTGSPGVAIAPGQECQLRVEPGQYVTFTQTDLSLPKPFDLAAWVGTDPFFAPLTANSNWRLDQNSTNGMALLPNLVAESVTASAPGITESMGINQTDCPLNVADNPFGGATAPLNFLPPPVLPAPPEIRYVPLPPPVRGLW